MFDYATGKWAPARFKNYVTGEWSQQVPSADVTLQVGGVDSVLGRSAVQIAREGWGQQKSQYGGANPALSGPAATSYHLWAVAPEAAAKPGQNTTGSDLFHNRKVNIGTNIEDLAPVDKPDAFDHFGPSLHGIGLNLRTIESESKHRGLSGLSIAQLLTSTYGQTIEVRKEVAASKLNAKSRADLLFALDTKIDEFQNMFCLALGLELTAFTTKADSVQSGGILRGSSADEMPRSVVPGSSFRVRIHTAQATSETHLAKIWFESHTGDQWKPAEPLDGAENAKAPDHIFSLHVPENAEQTQPYFTRPSIEQPFYDIARPELRLRSFAPYPLAAWAEFSFDGLPIRVGQVVQTLQRVPGLGGIYEPLVVTPSIGVRMEPTARILPLDGSALPVRVTVHAEAAAEGTVTLELPVGWHSNPAEAHFHRDSAGDTEPV
jgi:hypothetical protein